VDDVHNNKDNVTTKLSIQKGEALYYLGLFYEHGFGVDKSPKRAINLYLKAS
jgi:TPR repeat protein